MLRNYAPKKSIKNAEKDSYIASVGKEHLYASDLLSMDLLHTDVADRDFFIKKYVEEWASKQLLIAQADPASMEPSIEGRVNDYRNDLLAYHFLEALIQPEFNTDVSSEEIADYYQKYKQRDFILPHDIVRGIFLALPSKAACTKSIRSLILSNKAADREKLKAYCSPYSDTTFLETDKWLPWEAVLAKIGYPPVGDATRLLKINKFIHVAGQKHTYFLKIDQYKLAQEIAPLESVENRIKAIILHKRKLDLIHKIKCKRLEDAKKNHTCVIHIN